MGRVNKAVASALGTLLIAGVGLIIWLRLAPSRGSCDRVQTVLSREHNRSVISVFEACTDIGTSVQEWIDLVGPSGRRARLLTFVPWGGETSYRGVPIKGPFEPSVTWRTPNDLLITIGTVEQVTEQRGEVEGVHVAFNIRTDLSKLRD